MSSDVEDLSSGNRVGPYTLLFRLGKGGMGEVWCASASRSNSGAMGDFQKLVALKLLRDAEAGSNSTLMFFDEARTAAALQHASIVPTLDLGQAFETYYLAMEMVRGPSLTALLQRLALEKMVTPPAVVAYIGERLASALDYAYARAEVQGQKLRLVHRDVSPHNVLLDQSGNVILSDFGVARTAVQDHLSRVGTVRGKPSYMAPEQVNGGEIDGRTDIFALGTVLYEAACVKRLFGRGKPMASMRAVLEHDPEPLAEKVPGFPPELAAVIHRALEKRPEDRFQNASELLTALADCSRRLPGAATVQRDLAELIGRLFPGAAFDVEGRAREALSFIAETTRTDAMAEAELAASTVIADRPVAPMAWPMASHPDPLAPEALEEAAQERTRFEHMQTVPAATGRTASQAGAIPPVGPRLTTTFLASALVAAALGLGGLVWMASQRTPTPVELPVQPASARLAESPTPKVTEATESERNAVIEEPTKSEVTPAPKEGEVPDLSPLRPGGKGAASDSKGKGRADAPEPPKPKLPAPERFPATFKGALACVRVLEAVPKEDVTSLRNAIGMRGRDAPPEAWPPFIEECVARLAAARK